VHFENVLLARLFQIEYLARPHECGGRATDFQSAGKRLQKAEKTLINIETR
jgi:hypothetical protein